MRSLSAVLGVVPMALYKHVADKEDLLDGMVDEVIGEFVPAHPSDPAQWKSEIRSRVLSARHALTRHPWARRAIETRTIRTPAVLSHMETLTRNLLEAGLTPDLVHHAMHALGNRIWGFSPELFNAPAGASAPRRPRTSGAPDPEDYPALLTVSADAAARRPGSDSCDEEFEFLFALDMLLDAIERLHDGGWSSPGGHAQHQRPLTPRPR
ncbi:MAG: TetR/AcrR family transcriptional regulator C-terminal domain-containing protein [Humibacillus sp.]|nr:TetR/AcrR family transcriptional regulator C-terminal domain-containing protein [Humibacillus sp.]